MFKSAEKRPASQEKTISEVGLVPGTRLTIVVPSNVTGHSSISVFSSYETAIGSDKFLITAPMFGGELYPLREGDHVQVQYVTEKAFFETNAVVVERFVKDNLPYMKMKSESYVRRNQRRNDFRLNVSIDSVVQITLEANPGLVAKDSEKFPAVITNLSGGGAALYSSIEANVGMFMTVNLPSEIFGYEKRMISQVHWVRSPDIESPYKHYMGVRFIFDVMGEKETLIKYTFEMQRKQLKR